MNRLLLIAVLAIATTLRLQGDQRGAACSTRPYVGHESCLVSRSLAPGGHCERLHRSAPAGLCCHRIATINVAAGFLVTHRMLRMFKGGGGEE